MRAKRGRTKRGRSRDPGIPGLEPLKAEKKEKPEFRIWTGKSGKNGKTGIPDVDPWKPEKAENTEKTEDPAARKTQEKERKVNSGMRYGIFGRNRNELRNKVRNCWHKGPETTENGKRNLKKGLCSRDTFGAATFGGLGFNGHF